MGKYKVTSNSLNVRSGPGTNYNKVDTLGKNSVVEVSSISNGWANVGANKYCSASYLTQVNEQGNTYNIITGSGGGLLEEGLTRDTDRWAIKVSYVELDGTPVNVQKSPKTDMTKSSKTGILKLHKSAGKFSTIESAKEQFGINNGYTDELDLVFENGVLYREQTFEEIREIANSYL